MSLCVVISRASFNRLDMQAIIQPGEERNY